MEEKTDYIENFDGTGAGAAEVQEAFDIQGIDFEALAADTYTFKLESFEGPLELLSELIRKSKMSIEDVKISEITEQYMIYMKDIDTVDLERASEFITMAAWLLEIKSKALLPKPELAVEDEIDGEKLLKQKLEEYRLYKDASKKMKEIETVDILFRDPDAQFINEPRFVLKDMNKEGLMAALQKMFLKLEKRAVVSPERQIKMDRFTVEEKMLHIRDVIDVKSEIIFVDLFDADYSKSEIITTFQALLELLKMQFVSAKQDEVFGEILIRKVA